MNPFTTTTSNQSPEGAIITNPDLKDLSLDQTAHFASSPFSNTGQIRPSPMKLEPFALNEQSPIVRAAPLTAQSSGHFMLPRLERGSKSGSREG